MKRKIDSVERVWLRQLFEVWLCPCCGYLQSVTQANCVKIQVMPYGMNSTQNQYIRGYVLMSHLPVTDHTKCCVQTIMLEEPPATVLTE